MRGGDGGGMLLGSYLVDGITRVRESFQRCKAESDHSH